VNLAKKYVGLKRLWLVSFGLLLALAATNAYAVPPNEIVRSNSPLIFNGPCCSFSGEKVFVTEPATPVPVIVSWSEDFTNSGGVDALASVYYVVGLSVNGGPCQAYGSQAVYPVNFVSFLSRTYRWAVFPTDGPPANKLHKGSNSFELCSGGMDPDLAPQTQTILRNTLSVRLVE